MKSEQWIQIQPSETSSLRKDVMRMWGLVHEFLTWFLWLETVTTKNSLTVQIANTALTPRYSDISLLFLPHLKKNSIVVKYTLYKIYHFNHGRGAVSTFLY